MKPKLYSYLAFVLFAAIFVIACKKGDTGPAGPAGPAGAAGAPGAPGAKGDSATANVTYSAWLDVTFLPDTVRDPNVDTLILLGYYATISAPKITSAVLSQGEIKTYVNFATTANPNVVPLPYTDIIFFGSSITATYSAGAINLYSNGNASSYTDSDGKELQYRYVIIPGTKPAAVTPGVNWNDYNSVKNFLNLPI